MITRRTFALASAVALATPALRAQTSEAQSPEAQSVAEATPQLHSLLVMRGDDTLIERAPRGPGLDRPANIKSCSKSIVALLLGSVIDTADINGLDATLADVAPDLIPANATEGVPDLTMEDLVTLRMGLDRTSGANYGAWVASPDWIAYALTRDRVAENGGRMLYSTGTTHVLGAALVEATGDSLLALARTRLGTPLGIEIPPWTRDPQGYYFGGNEMALTPRAMLRLAQMVRDGGRWQDAQVIPEDWITASRQPRTRSPYSGLSYGLGWFLSDTGWMLARGYGGQIIAANTDAGLAVAITSDPTQPARSEGYFGDLMALLDGPILSLA